jgi:hypothetical protein
MLVDTRPTKTKKPEQTTHDRARQTHQGPPPYLSEVFWEMSAHDALKVNYLIHEHQSIKS